MHECHGCADRGQRQGCHAGLAAQRETQTRNDRQSARHAGCHGQLLISQRLQADRIGRLIDEGAHPRGLIHMIVRMHQGINPICDEGGSERGRATMRSRFITLFFDTFAPGGSRMAQPLPNNGMKVA